MKKNFILFLTGRYNTNDLPYYRSMLPGKTTIAVDGGFNFFKKIQTYPDFIIGDLDSVRLPKNLPPSVKVLSLPIQKDKTDSQKAVEFCLENKPRSIEIVMPIVGEVDHFIGNIMLLTHKKIINRAKKGCKIKIINIEDEIILVVNGKITFNKSNGDMLSVIPISGQAELTTVGTEYNVNNKKVTRGDSLSLRNRITSARAAIDIKGEALIYHKFRK